MNIAYASDDNFVDVMLVSIMSFNDHNSDATIYILDCGITEQNKQKILELCSGKNTVLFVDAKKKLSEIDHNLNLDRGSIASYARLFVGYLLPQNVEKVIYLDSDTLVMDSLKELYDTDISPFIIGGIRDSFSLLNKKVFGLKKGDLFINAGVLLIDLARWRNQKIEEKVYAILKKKEVFQADQGVINMLFTGKVFELPLKYDVMTYLYDFTYDEMMLYRKPDDYFEKKVVDEAKYNPVIVHFSSSFASNRPWQMGKTMDHPYYLVWNGYFSKIEGVKNIAGKKAYLSKNKFFLAIIGLVHAYLRPMKYLL